MFGDVTEKLSEYITFMLIVALQMLTNTSNVELKMELSGTSLFPQLRMFSKMFQSKQNVTVN